MDKKELRKEYINIRKSIVDKKEKSKKVFKNLIENINLDNINNIGIYSNLEDEVDTIEITKYLLENKKYVFYPKVLNSTDMALYKVNSLNDLNLVGSFGIKEPTSNKENLIENEKIDLMIIPGICFDIYGNRIGFGKGYYDKYLYNCLDTKKIAICFDEQILDENKKIDCSKNDIKMDIIISDKRVIK